MMAAVALVDRATVLGPLGLEERQCGQLLRVLETIVGRTMVAVPELVARASPVTWVHVFPPP